VRLALLVALSLCLALPLFDQRAAERSPYHEHIVLGASGPEAVQALSSHHHRSEQPHRPDPLSGRPPAARADHPCTEEDVRVIAIPALGGAQAALLSVLCQGLLLPEWLALPPPPFWGQHPSPSVFAPSEATLPVPEPPPRSSFSLSSRVRRPA